MAKVNNNAGTLYATIELRLTQLENGIKNALNSFKGFAKGIKTTGAELQTSTGKLEQSWVTGYAVMTMAVHKLHTKVTSAFKTMIGVYSEYNQSLANTQSVARATADELALMDENARRVGATTRSTASEAANALYYLASAGFSATEAVAALDGVNALAIATQSDLAKTSETVATITRQYGLETAESTRIANVFTAAITNSLATMNKLTKSFEYVGPIAAGLGLSIEETTGALQVLYNQGFSGEKAGRGLRTILINLADSTSIVNKRLSRLGITFDQVNPAANELGDIFDVLRENGVNATNAASIFGKVSGVQLQALISKASDAEGGIKELTAAVTDTNRAFEAMEIQMDTLKGSFDKFKNAQEAIRLSIGGKLEPIMRALYDTGTALLLILNKFPDSLLAIAAIVPTVASGILSFSLGLTAVKLGLAKMGLSIGALIPSFAALVSWFSLAAAGIGAYVGAVAYANSVNKKYYADSAKAFGDLAKEMQISESALEDFFFQANQVGVKASRLSKASVQDAFRLKEALTEIADAEGLAVWQVLEMAKANDKFVQKAGISIGILENMLSTERELYNQRVENAKAQAEAELKSEISLRKRAKMMLEQMRIEALNHEKVIYNTEEAYSGLEKAFKQSAEYQKLLGNEYDRNTALTNAYQASLKLLIEQGLSAESEEIKRLIELYELYQKKYNFRVKNKEQIADAEIQKKAYAELDATLAEINEREKLSTLYNIEYNAELERSNAVLKAINLLLDNQFTIQGGGIQRILKGYGNLIVVDNTRLKLAEEYQKKMIELWQTEEQRAIAKAGNDEEAINAIKEYYQQLKMYTDLEKDYNEKEKARENATKQEESYNEKLRNLYKTNLELIEVERQRALSSVEGFKDAENAVNAYYDALIDKEKLELFKKRAKDVLDTMSDLSSRFANLISNSYDTAIKEQETALQNILDSLDAQEQAALEAAGITEENEREKMLNQLALLQDEYAVEVDLARRAALEEQMIAKQKEIAKYDIQQEYAQKRADAEAEAAKKIAQLQYKRDVVNWHNDRTQALTSGVLAVMKTWEKFGWPWGIVPAALMGGLAAANYGQITKNKPQPPKFNDGGIVPGSSYRGDKVPAFLNSGELILNESQQKNVADKLNQAATPTILYATLFLDLGNEIIEKQVQVAINDGRITTQKGAAIR